MTTFKAILEIVWLSVWVVAAAVWLAITIIAGRIGYHMWRDGKHPR